MDESWFYLMEDGTSLPRVLEIEVAADPRITHKSHVEKIMFLSVLLNVNDLGFFASLKSECRDMETYVLERDRMMDIGYSHDQVPRVLFKEISENMGLSVRQL